MSLSPWQAERSWSKKTRTRDPEPGHHETVGQGGVGLVSVHFSIAPAAASAVGGKSAGEGGGFREYLLFLL